MGVSINGVPQNRWFIIYNIILMENPIEMDDLWVPPFQETSTCGVPNQKVWVGLDASI
jgi:hypothetical protein